MNEMLWRHWISSNYLIVKWNGTLIKISYNSPSSLWCMKKFVALSPMVLICYLNYSIITHPWFGSTSRSTTSRMDVVNQQRNQQCEHKNITFVQFHYWLLFFSAVLVDTTPNHLTWLDLMTRLKGNFFRAQQNFTHFLSIFDVHSLRRP